MDIYLPPNIQLSDGLQMEQQGEQQQQQGGQALAAAPATAQPQQQPLAAAAAAAAGEGAPMVLFCHGGVWAAGAKWHYAPLAARLAQAGVVTAVMQVGLVSG